MRIIVDWPPNIDALREAFPIEDRTDVVFSYGDRVYSPGSPHISPSIQAHERMHCARQMICAGGVEAWWLAYIADPSFRLAEEIPAHRAEYQWWAARTGADKPVDGFRSARLYHLTHIARRLSSPMYGSMINLAAAKRALEVT